MPTGRFNGGLGENMVQLESNKQKLKGSAINHTHQSRPGQHATLVGLQAATMHTILLPMCWNHHPQSY